MSTSSLARYTALQETPGTAIFDKASESLYIAGIDGEKLVVKSLKTEGRRVLAAKQWWIGAARQDDSIVFGS